MLPCLTNSRHVSHQMCVNLRGHQRKDSAHGSNLFDRFDTNPHDCMGGGIISYKESIDQ